MGETLGEKAGRYLSQFFISEGLINPADFLALVETDPLEQSAKGVHGIISEENFTTLTKEVIIDRLKAGNYHATICCIFPKFILERLGIWKPWLTFEAYLRSQDMLPFVVFENTSTRVDGEPAYFAEIRVIPNISVTK